MKKNLFMVAAVALLATVSCNKEELGNNGVQGGTASDIVFVAEIAQPENLNPAPASVQSKTSIGAAGEDGVRAVTWNTNDKITVNGVEFTASDEGASVTFTTNAAFSEAETYYAAYPAGVASGADLSAVTIPASQSGTFAEASISVAQSSTQILSFKNVASMLKFQVPAAASKVTIESTSNLAGTFPVTFDKDGKPVIGEVSNGSKKITLTGSFKTGTDYYVAVLPGSHKFTIRLDGYLSKASTKTTTTSRAVIGDLKTLPIPEEWGWIMKGGIGAVYMLQSTTYTDLYVAKNVSLATAKTFKFYNREGNKIVGAWGTSGNVNCNGQVNSWYVSDATSSYAANIYISTTGYYDVYFSPENLDFLIIKTGVEDVATKWSMIGWINNKDSWNGTSDYIFNQNYITTEISLTATLTSSDYFLFVNDKWNGGWIGSPGDEWKDGGRNTTSYSINSGNSKTVSTYHSYDNHKAQFHMNNSGNYKIELQVGNQHSSAKVIFTRL